MSDLKVDIVLLGQCQPGMEAEQVVPRLAKLFKQDSANVRKMLAKGRLVIKKNVDRNMAEKYKLAIEKVGGTCELREALIESQPKAVAPPIDSGNDKTVIAPPGTMSPKVAAPAAEKTVTKTLEDDAPKAGASGAKSASIAHPDVDSVGSNAESPVAADEQADSIYQSPAAEVSQEPEVYCRHCGSSISASAIRCPKCNTQQVLTKSKDKTVAGLLALFLGGFGVHRFYLGQWWGIFYLLLWGTMIPSLVSLVEAIVFFVSSKESWERKYSSVPSSSGVIVAAVIGIFIMVMQVGVLAAVAIPAYQDYTIRARVSSGMPLVRDTQARVADVITSTGNYPSRNQELGLPDSLGNDAVNIALASNATIVASFKIKELGIDNTIEWAPRIRNGQVEWTCYGGLMPDRYRMSECRGGPQVSVTDRATPSLPGSVNAAETDSPSTRGLEQTVRSRDSRLSLQVPENWNKMDELNEEASLGVGNLFEDTYYLILEEPKADFEDGYTLTAYTDLIQSLMYEALRSPTLVYQRRTLTVNGLQAEQMAFSGSTEGIKVTYLLTTIEGENHYYQIIGWTLTSRFEDKVSLLQDVAGSFRESSVNRGVK
ncbi:NINE protein [Hahella ganghwensis]|uniref:NINE protein n=1 Tax=Hahella ganghwensis TaxID=286420 RepID=UPI0003777218|nr:NINE protein [Hahella ganghwensis]